MNILQRSRRPSGGTRKNRLIFCSTYVTVSIAVFSQCAKLEAQLVAASSRSLLARWFGVGRRHMRQTQDTLAALEKGYALTLDRLDQALQDYHLCPISCEGHVFDPHRMTAVELEETDSVPEGTVVGVYRSGYEWEGEVYRSAQVKVARAPRERAQKEREI